MKQFDEKLKQDFKKRDEFVNSIHDRIKQHSDKIDENVYLI